MFKKFSSEYKEYMNSQEWENKRQEKLASVGHRCEMHGEVKLGWFQVACTGPLQVHHLHYRTLGNESMGDLQALCYGHHQRQHKHMPKSNGRAHDHSHLL
jgi:5-methylcytosine-specific restriction endonuclease McrA